MDYSEIILGLDLGDRHIGVAIGNLITKTATPLPDLANDRSFIDAITSLQHEYGFNQVVVGLPVTATGQHGEQAHKTIGLVDQLRQIEGLEVILEDERFTTQAATKFMAQNPEIGGTIDGVSAKLILEGWLARH